MRFFDTLGSFFGLLGLLLGLFSVLCDQYDLEFEFEGELKDFADGLSKFQSQVENVVDTVNNIIKKIDYKITCEHIYSIFAGGSTTALILSILPGKIICIC